MYNIIEDGEEEGQPVLFEECYALAESQKFIDDLRASSKLGFASS